MSDKAPERIWAWLEGLANGDMWREMSGMDGYPGDIEGDAWPPTRYVRADLHDAVVRERDAAELKAENRGIIIGKQERRIQDLRERLAAAEKERTSEEAQALLMGDVRRAEGEAHEARQRAEAAEKERDELREKLADTRARLNAVIEIRNPDLNPSGVDVLLAKLRAKLCELEAESRDQQLESLERDR